MEVKSFVMTLVFEEFSMDYIYRDIDRFDLYNWAEEQGFSLKIADNTVTVEGRELPCYSFDMYGRVTLILDGDEWFIGEVPTSINLVLDADR